MSQRNPKQPRLSAPERLEDRTVPAADLVLEWNEIALDAVRSTSASPPKASRALAIVHAAVFDAVNAIDREHHAYAADFEAPSDASKGAAVAAAAHDALVSLFPALTADFDAELAADLAGIPDGASENAGVAAGQHSAALLLAARSQDGSQLTPAAFVGGNDPGEWRPTPPALANGLLPNWADLTPFTMSSPDQFRPEAPPELSSAEYAADFNEVKSLGSVASITRTADQTQIALYWADGAGTATPPGHWNSIAQVISEQRGLSLEENARLFALLNLALADAAIASWDAKYEYVFWRPITAIANAADDANDATQAEASWQSLIRTPPFPSYTSGHSTFSGAAATVLAQFFGSDQASFTSDSDSNSAEARSFQSFSQAAAEAGRSRVFGGIHYEFDNQAGLAAGQAVAEQAVDEFLKPVERSAEEAFVRDLYHKLLGRHGESAGLQGFIQRLQEGEDRHSVVNEFLSSEEFRNKQISQLYLDILSRAPDAGGLAGFVESGRDPQEVRSLLLASNEYFVQAGSPADGIDGVFRLTLDRSAEASAVASYAGAAAGDEKSRIAFVSEVVGSREAFNAFLDQSYAALLERTPDEAGRNGFLKGYDEEGTAWSDVLVELLSSNEFFAKSGPAR